MFGQDILKCCKETVNQPEDTSHVSKMAEKDNMADVDEPVMFMLGIKCCESTNHVHNPHTIVNPFDDQ